MYYFQVNPGLRRHGNFKKNVKINIRCFPFKKKKDFKLSVKRENQPAHTTEQINDMKL